MAAGSGERGLTIRTTRCRPIARLTRAPNPARGEVRGRIGRIHIDYRLGRDTDRRRERSPEAEPSHQPTIGRPKSLHNRRPINPTKINRVRLAMANGMWARCWRKRRCHPLREQTCEGLKNPKSAAGWLRDIDAVIVRPGRACPLRPIAERRDMRTAAHDRRRAADAMVVRSGLVWRAVAPMPSWAIARTTVDLPRATATSASRVEQFTVIATRGRIARVLHSEKPQGRVGRRQWPLSPINVEAGSSGSRQPRAARCGRKALKGKQTSGEAPDGFDNSPIGPAMTKARSARLEAREDRPGAAGVDRGWRRGASLPR
jgi:hypothetical protein